MTYELGHPMLDEETLRHRVRELGEEISRDYAGKSVVCVGVLKGSVIFLADLVRAVDGGQVDIHLDFMAVSSYGGSTESSGVVKILKDLEAARSLADVEATLKQKAITYQKGKNSIDSGVVPAAVRPPRSPRMMAGSAIRSFERRSSASRNCTSNSESRLARRTFGRSR